MTLQPWQTNNVPSRRQKSLPEARQEEAILVVEDGDDVRT